MDGVPADDRSAGCAEVMPAQAGGDGLRGGGVAFLETDNVRAGVLDGIDATGEALSALASDIEAHHLDFGDCRAGDAAGQRNHQEPGPEPGQMELQVVAWPPVHGSILAIA